MEGASSNTPPRYLQYVVNTRGGPVYFDLPPRYLPKAVSVPNGSPEIRVLGSGSQGVVIKCRDVISGEDVAIKKMLNPFTSELPARRAFREFMLLRRMPHHRNIISLRDAFISADTFTAFSSFYVVTDLLDYDLAHFLRGAVAKNIPHTNLSYLLYQMLCAVNHLHRFGIIHRDLKPANLAIKESGCELRLLDFGLARCPDKVKMSTYVYTRWYRAPEVVLEREYTSKADIWAIGCIFAEILKGEVYLKGMNQIDQWFKIAERFGMPSENFKSKLQPHVIDLIKQMTPPNSQKIPFEYQFPDCLFPQGFQDDLEHPEKFCAEQARDLLAKMLNMDPENRLSAEEALAHPYVNLWYDSSDVTREVDPAFIDYDTESQESSSQLWKQNLWTEITNYMSSAHV